MEKIGQSYFHKGREIKRISLPLGILILFMTVCLHLYAGQGQPDTYSLFKVWQTDRVLKVPESVLYDSGTKLIYVSNINGNPGKKDGNGFITKLAADGRILKLKWAKALNAPKGMAIFKGKLYISDIDRLICIDLSSGRILQKFLAPGAQFLNDVAVNEVGSVYVSDSSGKKSVIYRLKEGKMEAWLKGPEIKNPNGLFYKDGILYIGNSGDGKIKAVNIETKKITTVANIGSGIDGLILDKEGFFIVSDWSGKTSLVTKDGRLIVLLNTTDRKINAADLGYIPEKQIILIPTFFDNRIVAYKLSQK